MDKQQCNSLQNFDGSKSEILKKRLLKSVNTSVTNNSQQSSAQNNALLNTLRAPISSSMIVSSVQAPQNSMSITHNLVTQSITPVKIHANNSPYPLQLSTVHVPVQIPGSTSNINVPVQLSGPTSTVPLQLAPVSLPLQVSGTTTVPVQLSAGETINVPLQIPGSQNIQLTGPLLQNNNQALGSIFHVHMGSNSRATSIDGSADLTVSNPPQLQISDSSGVQMKMNNSTPVSQVQVGSNQTVVQIPSSTNNSIQLRGVNRPMPHVVYIQTQSGLKPVTNTEVISQASTSGNPPQIIVRRPVTSNSNLHLLSNVNNKPNIAPKVPVPNKSSILAPVNASQPIVIQKPKPSDKVVVPVSIAPGAPNKQAIAYLGSVKKPNTKNISENQSILISNNQSSTPNNNKLFVTPMNVPKIQNTKFILPVTLPATMASKGPIINLQIANGQIQNDPQGNITVMRDTGPLEPSEVPPLQPLGKVLQAINGKDSPQGTQIDKPFTISIPGSRAEPTGEQGEYTLSIPETNASMNDDIYTVSIEDDEGGHTQEKSFTLAIPEKSKSLLNKNIIDRMDAPTQVIAAPAILRRSNSDNSERKTANANLKRRISLCTDNLSNKNIKLTLAKRNIDKIHELDGEINDDHRVPSLFCDEKLDKDLETKNVGDSDNEEYKVKKASVRAEGNNGAVYYCIENYESNSNRVKSESETSEDDPPGLLWTNGIATLQGSMLQFQTNEFGLIDLIDSADAEEMINRSIKYQTPLKQRIDRNSRDKKPTSPEDLYRCDGCGCHGMAAEFITPNFCSSTCQSVVEKQLAKRRDRERAELMKKRNRIKKLLMRKQPESEVTSDNKDNYDSVSIDNLSETSAVKINDDTTIENEKYPWMCGKNGFSWMRYLEVCKARAAPGKVFKNPFPYTRNGFRVGMRMEAIDPQHPALFCVVSVAEVQGFRMRLHFDEYPDMYDYWVNADSVDIFPPGWCEKNGRTLQPPANFNAATFSWPLYLKQMRVVAAPRQLFAHVTTTVFKPNCFRVGMKLEAEDRKHDLICVATVADMLDNRLRINFDSWDEMYDYWVEPNSPLIHPVGWAEKANLPLTPPNFYKDPDTFSWENYLSETNSVAAPPRAFKTRLPQGFKPAMKLEVVDKRVPFLIRVATISAVRGHQVRVAFDGWPDELAYWLDDDSPDLHPVGWCLKTGHPLEPPLTEEELSVAGPCGVGGCRGLGSALGGAHKEHGAAAACPYSRPRRAARARLDRTATPTHKDRRYHSHKEHGAAAACPYSRPRRAARARLDRTATPTHKDRRYHSHKEHGAAAACPYSRPRRAARARLDRTATPTHKDRRYHSHKEHGAAAACPYSRPRRAARARLDRTATPTHKDRRYHSHKEHGAAAACPYSRPRRAARARLDRTATPTHKDRRYHSHKEHGAAAACPYSRPRRAARARLDRTATPTHKDRRYHSHKEHGAAAACPYSRPRRAARARLDRTATPTHKDRRYHSHKEHGAAAACPYSRPRRAARARLDRTATPTHKDRRYHSHKEHGAAAACPYSRPRRAARARLDRTATPTHKDRRYHSHKEHGAAAACPYSRPRRAARARLDRTATPTHKDRRYHSHKEHGAAAACPYSRPRRAARARLDRTATPTHKDRRYHSHKEHGAAAACPYSRPRRAARARLDRTATPTHKDRRYHSHKEHGAAAACPYSRPRRAARARLDRTATPTHKDRRYHSHKEHGAAAACPYSRPRRAARARLDRTATPTHKDRRVIPKPIKPPSGVSTTSGEVVRTRGRPPKHKRVEQVTRINVSDEESVSSGGGKVWRGSGAEGSASPPPRAPARYDVMQHVARLGLPPDPALWNEEEAARVAGAVAGAGAGARVRGAGLRGAELVMCSREELVSGARLRLGPAVKLYHAVRQLRRAAAAPR